MESAARRARRRGNWRQVNNCLPKLMPFEIKLSNRHSKGIPSHGLPSKNGSFRPSKLFTTRVSSCNPGDRHFPPPFQQSPVCSGGYQPKDNVSDKDRELGSLQRGPKGRNDAE